MKESPQEHKHDFIRLIFHPIGNGEWAPTLGGAYQGIETFSVGIFQWVPRISGKGLKRSKVKYRVRGKHDNYEKVYARARQVCSVFDEMWEEDQSQSREGNQLWGTHKKSETVK